MARGGHQQRSSLGAEDSHKLVAGNVDVLVCTDLPTNEANYDDRVWTIGEKRVCCCFVLGLVIEAATLA